MRKITKFPLVVVMLLFGGLPLVAAKTNEPASQADAPKVIESDGHLRLDFGPQIMVVPRGLQPSMLCTASGALVVQAQIPKKPFPSSRMTYPWAMETRISRDDGKTWNVFSFPPGENGLNMEGGAVQLRDGTILALDTYITPGAHPDEGIGQLYASTNDWHTLAGPQDVTFDLPNADYYSSKDDGGHPYEAERLHRRIIELPDGNLLATVYGIMKGDKTPATYMPTMMKTRVMLVGSKDRGQHWKFISTVAVDPTVGTEGYGEPVLAHLRKGPHAGRLICLMRTGRELRETRSDDDGVTWNRPQPLVFAALDVYQTKLWVNDFRNIKDRHGKLLDEKNPDELRGAVVDPDLIELRSGILVAAFGVRIPQKACFRHPEFPWNGNYLAFSLDHGQTWSNVVQLTSGVFTTHYMAVEETLVSNRIFVTYDLGGWTKGMNRNVWGRFVDVAMKSK